MQIDTVDEIFMIEAPLECNKISPKHTSSGSSRILIRAIRPCWLKWWWLIKEAKIAHKSPGHSYQTVLSSQLVLSSIETFERLVEFHLESERVVSEMKAKRLSATKCFHFHFASIRLGFHSSVVSLKRKLPPSNGLHPKLAHLWRV